MDRIILLLLLSVDAKEGKCNGSASTDMQYVCKEVSASNDQFIGSILLVCYGVGCRYGASCVCVQIENRVQTQILLSL